MTTTHTTIHCGDPMDILAAPLNRTSHHATTGHDLSLLVADANGDTVRVFLNRREAREMRKELEKALTEWDDADKERNA